jgi:hypothetical protein
VEHELTDHISLELGRRVVERLRQRPELLQIADANLNRWSRLNHNAPSLLRCYDEWREILKRPLKDVCDILVSDNEEARRLRQNSPFVGILNAREIWELKNSFRHATPAA